MRVAVITHAFPPSRHANGKRPYYIVKGFLDAGWEVDVYTSALGCDPGFEETLERSGCRIIRLADPVVRWLDRVKPVRLLHKLATFATNGLIWPDFYALWSRKAVKRVKEGGAYDRVLAFVFPPSMYLAARMGAVDGSWVFDLQESVSPQYEIAPRRSPLQRWRQPALVELERKALHAAGAVVYTAATNREVYRSKGLVSVESSEHVPYFYDDEVFGQAGVDVEPLFEITYFGTFDWRGSRSPKVFLGSLARFLDQHPEAREKTRFVFYGTWLQEHDGLIEDYQLGDVVDIRDAVPYAEYLDKVRRSPVFLLVVAAEHNLFMPSKIVDYFGAGRPILAYVPRDSEMRRVLDKAGMAEQAMDEDDVEAGALALASLWRRYEEGSLDELASDVGYWSSGVQIPRYLEVLKQLKANT